MKHVISVAFMLCIGVTTVFAQEDTQYGDKLREMFSVSGASANYDVVVDQMLTMFKNSYGNQAAELRIRFGMNWRWSFGKAPLMIWWTNSCQCMRKHLTIEDWMR